MAGMKWNDEQKQVIAHRGSSLLVSAAAGSGKTAVLVERIVARLLDEAHPMDVDHLLVVTFTNAAASEMRERIQKRLSELLETEKEEEKQNRISRQLSLLNHAQISTIHSFCKNLIRNYFMEIGVEPSLRLADETELSLWKQDVMEAVLEEAYGSIDENPAFLNFVESFSTGKKDDGLSKLLLRLYHTAVSFPYPEEWLRECAESGKASMEESGWYAFMEEDVRESLAAVLEEISEGIALCQTDSGFLPYLETLQSDEEMIEGFIGLSFKEMCEQKESLSFARMKSISKKAEVDEELKKEIKEIRDRGKKAVNDLCARYLIKPLEQMEADLQKTAPLVEEMVRLTLKFMEKFQAEKEERKVMDFNDLEHFALHILIKKEDGKLIRTPVAEELTEYYEEIMIDEYQDSNQLQDDILTAIAKKVDGVPVNLFMVGDVKQSIYRFRNAKPELFMKKYAQYQLLTDETYVSGQPGRIDLSKNYRSRREVLASANHIFEAAMQERAGGIAYDEKARLYAGAEYPDFGEKLVTECLLVTAGEEIKGKEEQKSLKEEEEEKPDSQKEAEARCIARRIKELVRDKAQVAEGNGHRDLRYGDIVILLRTMSGWSEEFKEILMQEGVPACADTQSGYFSAREVRLMLNLLRIIDNPRQDIPLAAVLYSSLVGITKEELSEIRSTDREESLYPALFRFLELSGEENQETKEKIEVFFENLSKYRKYAACHGVAQLLSFLYEQTGYYAYVRALPAGERRCANLDMLRRKAEQYGESHYQGLYHFLRYMDQLFRYEIDFGEAEVPSAEADMVRIMSIHKSKGLEFPVVFAAGLGKSFNKMDVKEGVVIHTAFGIASDVIDYEKRIHFATLKKQAIRRKIWMDSLAEELRILYVALTRARERLILTGYIGDGDIWEKERLKAQSRLKKELSYLSLTSAASFLDILLPAIAYQGENLVQVRTIDQSELGTGSLKEQLSWAGKFDLLTDFDGVVKAWGENGETKLSKEQLRMLEEREFSYPFAESVELKGKVTVSELKKRKWQEMENNISEEPKEESLREEVQKIEEDEVPMPAFLQEEEKVSGAHRGTVYHTIMEKISFVRAAEKTGLSKEIERIFWETRMPEVEKTAVKVKDFLPLFSKENMEVTGRLKKAEEEGVLYREQPFVMGEPACRLYEGTKSEEIILIQGIIDVYFEEDGELVLLDYKTDHVPAETGEEELKRRYAEQLRLYGLALERATGKKLKEVLIYSFYLKKYISLDFDSKVDLC